MPKFVALYEKPADVEGFDTYYRETHLPLCEQWPHVQSLSTTRFTGTPRGGESPYYLMFEATYASDEDFQASMRSDEVRAAGKDAMELSQRFGAKAVILLGSDF